MERKLPLFYNFFFTHCLFVSLLCFLCPLPRQRCRWIGAVSVRDLCVISWNAHPSKHKKLNFKLFWTILPFNGISLTLCFSSKIKTLLHGGNIFYLSLWSTRTAKQRCQLASPINKLCKLKIVQSVCMQKTHNCVSIWIYWWNVNRVTDRVIGSTDHCFKMVLSHPVLYLLYYCFSDR